MQITNKIIKSEFIPWAELKKYDFNQLKDNKARDITKLKNSIINQGFSFALCNWADHRWIIDGTGRFLALLELEKEGYQIPDLTVIQIKAENIKEAKKLALMASSKHGEITQTSLADFASLDFDIEELKDLQIEELNLPELDLMIGSLEPPIEVPPEEGQDEVPELKKDPFVVRGDIFEITAQGCKYRVGCLDSTSVDDVEKLMAGTKIDMVNTDPPYGINEKGDRSGRGGMVEGNNLQDFKDDTTEYAIQAYNLCESLDIKIQVWWGANYYCHNLPQTNNWLVWDKRVEDNQVNTNSDCELTWVKSSANSVRIFRHLWKGLIKASEHGEKRVHPTQKPVELAVHCFERYAPDSKNILDLFCGSGYTTIACIKTKRNCYTCDISEHYTQVATKRCTDFLTKNNIAFEITLNGENFFIENLN